MHVFISHRSSDHGVREMVSLRETFILAEISDMKKVRKDIENGWLTRSVISDNRRLWFRWPDVVLLAAVYSNHFMNGPLRKRALERVKEVEWRDWTFHHASFDATSEAWQTRWTNLRKIDIDECLFLDLEKVLQTVGPRVDLYLEGLKKIEEKCVVLDGEPVFKGTRLSVLHIGKMYDRGESIDNILEDYPYLGGDDVRFAQLYYRAHPAVGRPRMKAGADNVAAEADVG